MSRYGLLLLVAVPSALDAEKPQDIVRVGRAVDDELANAHAGDIAAAEKKWARKHLIVSGRIARLGPDKNGDPAVVLQSNPANPAVSITFSSADQERQKSLKAGQSWSYHPGKGHTVAWVAVLDGALRTTPNSPGPIARTSLPFSWIGGHGTEP
jgi:hypothetical protein